MKVLLLNTTDKEGGAAIAASRLLNALEKEGIDTKMLVVNKKTANCRITSIDNIQINKLLSQFYFFYERLVIFITLRLKRKNLFKISIANTGFNLVHNKYIQEADIIHLHWINHGFLSLKDIDKILSLGKPVVWTMHDMWPCTGICHHSGECSKYEYHCQECPLINNGRKKDLSFQTFQKKGKIYNIHSPYFVTCSNWLKQKAELSKLFKNSSIINIPNPIDTTTFKKVDKTKALQYFKLPEDKKLILFGSMKITDEMKGINYLINASNKIVELYPELKNSLGLVVFGNKSEELEKSLPFPVYSLGFLQKEEEISLAYNTADLFINPSLQENLPNTIMEAMACGTPCVGFSTGGIPEMIDHKSNGYIATYKDTRDLTEGILWIINYPNQQKLSENARNKIILNYREEIIAKRYISLYNKISLRHKNSI